MQWIRYRLKTRSVSDYRPLVYNPAYPWWCSGGSGDGSYAVIVAWLPNGDPLVNYWDDAFDVEQTQHHEIVFTSRFPRPAMFVEAP